MKALPFEVQPNDGFQYIVTDTDGKRYRVTIRLAVMDISATGVGMIQPDGGVIPNFHVNAQFVTATVPIDAPDTEPAVTATTVNTGKKSMN